MIRGFHIEPTNICTLKCAGCSRTQFQREWPGRWRNHSLDIDVLDRFLDIDLSDLDILLCGNYGDPIYHPDLHRMVRMLKSRGSHVTITTNGSYKTQTWWNELVEILDNRDTVIFSIDGTPDNFTQYRENADWPSIEVGLRASISGSNRVIWKYIPFRFNEHTIIDARSYALELGVDEFQVSPSYRYDANHTEHLQPSGDLIDWKTIKRIEFKQGRREQIDPQCQDQRHHYISSDGRYMPCCFVGEHGFYYKTVFGQLRRDYDINHATLTQILDLDSTRNFYQNLVENPPSVCCFSCPTRG